MKTNMGMVGVVRCLAAAAGLFVVFAASAMAELAPSESAGKSACDYYMAMNGGDMNVIESFYTKDYLDNLMRMPTTIRDGVDSKMVRDAFTRNSSISKVTTVKEDFPPYGALVTVLIEYKDGVNQKVNLNMMKEDGVWKVFQ